MLGRACLVRLPKSIVSLAEHRAKQHINGEKKSPFSKIFGYVWRRPYSAKDGDLNDWVWGHESLDGIGVFLI